MNTQILLASLCLAVSFLNLVSTIFLSNFVFRILVADRKPPRVPRTPDDRGLVDLNYSPTYDPRFRDG